ncbi:MAG: hypothetical protein JSW73_01450 [Candidatus Woesearchaeota archaeon]|nr:MAG: hypothetical protein JSW73_01450 [Candidatus Woesearchaeota archaeon]
MVAMIQEILRKIGLNKYEKDAYLTLLKLGSITAYKLAKESGVPYGRIYDALEGLKLKGFIETIPGRPKLFKAIEPEHAIEFTLKEREREVKKLRNQTREVLKETKIKKTEKDFTFFENEASFFTNLMQRLKNCKEESVGIFTITSERGKNLTKHLESLHSGPERKAIIPVIEENKNAVNYLIKKGMKIRSYPIRNLRLQIIDKEIVLIAVKYPGKVVGFEIRDKLFALEMLKLYDALWDKAEPISQ